MDSLPIPPALLLAIAMAAAVVVGVWWVRRQHLNAQRRSMQAFYSLSEEIIAAASPVEIADKFAQVLPSVIQATTVRLYLYNRRTKSLESVATVDDPEPMAASVEDPPAGLAAGAVRCFVSRAPLNIPDVRRNPLVNAEWNPTLPRSVTFVPMLAQQDTLGILEAGSTRRLGYFSPEEQAALQHLANQAAAALKLQEQKSVREQLFRSEKLAATGQLISGVASDLRAPLLRIGEISSALLASQGALAGAAGGGELRQITTEAQRAAEIVSRLISFARPEDSAARQVDVNVLVGGLLQFRDREWKQLGLRLQNRLAPEAALVLGVQGQLEQVFLNLLVYAEQCAARDAAKTLSVSSTRMAGRVIIEIAAADRGDLDPTTENGMDVYRAIAQNHGGELRVQSQPGFTTFCVDLPLAPGIEPRRGAAADAPTSRSLTLMLVDGDLGAQRQLMGLLAVRGHRVIPVNAEEASDLAHRLRFDGVIWAVRSGGWKWSDFQERLRSTIPTFVLVSDGYDAELAASLAENGGYLLGRPFTETDLERVLQALDARAPSRNER